MTDTPHWGWFTLAFTGTRTLRSQDVGVVMDDARHDILDPVHRCFVSGACLGVDALLGRYAADLRDDSAHVVIVPADRSKVDPWWEHRKHEVRVMDDQWPAKRKAREVVTGPGLVVYLMPEGTSYRDRNRAMVIATDRLLGYAQFPQDHPRSKQAGTWITKGIADVYRVPARMTALRE